MGTLENLARDWRMMVDVMLIVLAPQVRKRGMQEIGHCNPRGTEKGHGVGILQGVI